VAEGLESPVVSDQGAGGERNPTKERKGKKGKEKKRKNQSREISKRFWWKPTNAFSHPHISFFFYLTIA
jgi:hypothetical protein